MHQGCFFYPGVSSVAFMGTMNPGTHKASHPFTSGIEGGHLLLKKEAGRVMLFPTSSFSSVGLSRLRLALEKLPGRGANLEERMKGQRKEDGVERCSDERMVCQRERESTVFFAP